VDQVVSQKIGYSVAGVKRTKAQQTQKQVKKSKPNKKEYEVKIQLAQGTPPRSGARPIVKMYIPVPGQWRFCARTMFNTRAAIPIISSTFIKQHNLPTINWDTPLRINGADSYAMPGAGEAFTNSLMLEYKWHFT
jgi:hypothetical protein